MNPFRARSCFQIPLFAFSAALLVRVAAIPSSLVEANPYSQGDALAFGETADIMAQNFLKGKKVFATEFGTTYETWGVFLMPFYLIPGPSTIYAHIFVACLGALAAYNVAAIAQRLHSRQAAAMASLPVVIYPSIVLTHATLLREAVILFCLTTAARVAMAPGQRLSTHSRSIVVLSTLSIATLLRQENALLYIIAIVTAVLVWYIRDGWHPWAGVGVAGVVASIGAYPHIHKGLIYLSELRSVRARGRTVYLEYIYPSTIPTAVAFSWVGAAYFLFAPFPWMIGTVADLVAAAEGVLNIGLFVAAVFGFVRLRGRYSPASFGVVAAFAAGLVLYGFGTANVGTAVRHRPMFLWVIFIFGSIWISERVKFVFG